MTGSILLLLALFTLAPGETRADTALDAYEAMRIKPREVLSGTVLTTRVIPGGEKQVVAMVTYLTGKRGEADSVNVRLEVFRKQGSELSSVYARDFGEENGGFVARGEIELVDLDGDGINELILTYDSLRDPLIRERRGELLVHASSGFRKAWSGPMLLDSTRAVRKLPAERRDHFIREIDVLRTLRSRGVTLFVNKKVISVAGERLPEPKVVGETFPLRPAPERR
jgi:hypothetical protein